MSLFSYNGVNLHLTRTRLFKVEPETDPSGADVLWNKYTLQVEGVLSESAGLPASSAATLAAVKQKISVPRRALSYSIAGTSILSVADGDARYGPEISDVSVTEPLEGTFFVSLRAVARLVDCSGAGNPVVSLRWEQTEDYDENWFFTLKTSGLLIVRTDLRQSADQFRALATPPVPNNCRRESSSYTLDPTGTKLNFRFTDKEQHNLPPYPATKASGRFVVSAPMPGAIRTAQVDVNLEGPPGADRGQLLLAATRVALVRLQAAGLQLEKNSGQAILGAQFSENLYECKAAVSLQARLRPIPRSLASAAVAGFGVTPGSSEPGTFGLAPPVRRALFGLFAAAFRDPCAALSAGQPGVSGGVAELRAGNPATLAIGDIVGTEVTLGTYSDGDPGGYDWYMVESEYSWDSGKALLPAAGGPNPGDRKGSIVQLHGGKATLVVTWTARRRGEAPVLPSGPSPDPNYVLLAARVKPEQIDASADGYSLIHTVSGRYEYGIIDPYTVSATAPVPPFLSDAAAEGAKLSAKYASDRVLWKFAAAPGPNPFVAGGQELDARPDNALAAQLGGAAVGAVVAGILNGGGNGQQLPGLAAAVQGATIAGGILGGGGVNP